jgi:hypothetical protein
MLRNRIEQDRKVYEMELKHKEKAKKHEESMKQNIYDKQIMINKKENKKMYVLYPLSHLLF